MFLNIMRIINVLLISELQQIKIDIKIYFLSFRKLFENLTTIIFFIT